MGATTTAKRQALNHLKNRALALTLAALFCLIGTPTPAQAQMPSAAQLQMLKSLSPDEQKRLAAQFGISVPNGQSTTDASAQQLPQTIFKNSELQSPEYQAYLSQLQANADQQTQEEDSDELPIFGMNVFAGKATSFSPIGDLPVPADYIVAPDDEIKLQLYGKTNEQYSLLVSRDGQINIPDLGPFSVVGKRFSQVRDELADKINKQIIGAQVSISMGELHSMLVYILGDANQPGAYQLSSLATATQAIIAAGGIADTGSLRQVEVRRSGALVTRIDLYDLLLKGNRGGDVRLQSGDAVFIPAVGPRVSIEGEVLRPAYYELARADNSLNDLLRNAGGALPSAYTAAVRVERQGANGLDVAALDVSQQAGRNFALQNGDRVYLDKKNSDYRNSIQLSGAFINAGQHGFKEGMQVSDVLSSSRMVLRDDADLSLAILVRQEPQQQITVRYIPIAEIQKNRNSQSNIALQAEDELLVLPAFVATQVVDDYADLQHTKDETSESKKAFAQYEAERQRLAQSVAIQDESLSAEQARLQDEALLSKTIDTIQTRRAALIAPIVEKLREQADSNAYEQVVEIAGEVKYPGAYPFMSGMPLDALLKIAGGLKENAFTDSAELARLESVSGQLRLQTSRVAITGMATRDFVLHAKDRINVFERPEWRETVAVEVSGEVKFPGTYTVARGTGFKELIERAGGYTDFAFPEGAVFTRESLKEKEQEQLIRLRDRLKEEVATLSLRKSSGISGISVSPGEAVDAVDKLSSVQALGRLVVDLPSLVASENKNVSLEDGDFVHIPAHSHTVTVVGEVQYPSSHFFEEGISYKEYLERAGGTRKRADNGRIYIIRANGQVAVAKNSWFGTQVEEGDTIVVPINAEYVDKLSVFGSVTQILYQLGVAYDVIKN